MHGVGQRALVVGGGLAGLAVALALRRSGWGVEVHEQAPELGGGGSGLLVTPNGMRVLERLEVAPRVVARGAVVTQGELCAWRGKVLAQLSGTELWARLGAPSILIHEAALRGVLLDALVGEGLHAGARLVRYDDTGPEVLAFFADGREALGQMLVGADGLRSAVRAQLHPADDVRYAGYACWRGLSQPFSHPAQPPGLLRETQGRGARFGVGHVGQGRVCWWATVSVREGWRPPAGDKAFLQEIFEGAHSPIPQLIAATEEADLLRCEVHDRLPLSRWGEGRVTLVGDAAHPMVPDLAQGASAALEDAAELAAALEGAREVEGGLRDYEARRVVRTARLQRDSRLYGRVGQWEDARAAWLRVQVLRRVSKRWVERGLERLWGVSGSAQA